MKAAAAAMTSLGQGKILSSQQPQHGLDRQITQLAPGDSLTPVDDWGSEPRFPQAETKTETTKATVVLSPLAEAMKSYALFH